VELPGALGEGGGAAVPAEGGLLQDATVKEFKLLLLLLLFLLLLSLFKRDHVQLKHNVTI